MLRLIHADGCRWNCCLSVEWHQAQNWCCWDGWPHASAHAVFNSLRHRHTTYGKFFVYSSRKTMCNPVGVFPVIFCLKKRRVSFWFAQDHWLSVVLFYYLMYRWSASAREFYIWFLPPRLFLASSCVSVKLQRSAVEFICQFSRSSQTVFWWYAALPCVYPSACPQRRLEMVSHLRSTTRSLTCVFPVKLTVLLGIAVVQDCLLQVYRRHVIIGRIEF